MKLLFIDVETTGLPRSFKSNPIETSLWPFIVQIAWTITDYNSSNRLVEKSYIIKPKSFVIPDDAIAIHKITNELANKNGVDIILVLEELRLVLRDIDVLVAHNIEFDIKVLKAEFYRNKINAFNLDYPLQFCTMKVFTDYCAIPHSSGLGNYKWPRLDEFYKKVWKEEMKVKHNAIADVDAIIRCFYKLKDSNVFSIENKVIQTYEVQTKKTESYVFLLILLFIIVTILMFYLLS